MDKKEKIQEAYGEHWGIFQNDVDENGFINCLRVEKSLLSFFLVEELEIKGKHQRPKSLQGIEDNNGWSKTLEDGLPKTTGEYIFLCPKKIQHTVFISNPLSRAETNHFKNDFTHYKPLKTEPLPLH